MQVVRKSECSWYTKHQEPPPRDLEKKQVTAQVALPAKYPDPGQNPFGGGRRSPKQDNDLGPTKDLD